MPSRSSSAARPACRSPRRSSPVVEALVISAPTVPVSQCDQQVRDEQQRAGGGQLGGAAGRGELEDGVERQVLQARRRRTAPAAGTRRPHPLGHALGPRVPVVVRVARAAGRRRPAARSPRPSCRCRPRRRRRTRRLAQPVQDALVQAEDVPVQRRRRPVPAGWRSGAPRSGRGRTGRPGRPSPGRWSRRGRRRRTPGAEAEEGLDGTVVTSDVRERAAAPGRGRLAGGGSGTSRRGGRTARRDGRRRLSAGRPRRRRRRPGCAARWCG